MKQTLKGLLIAVPLLASLPSHAAEVSGKCARGVCSVVLTPEQLLAKATQLVLAHQFDEARPMVMALANIPTFSMQVHFLNGYIAVETGDTDAAIKHFRAALDGHPDQTRIRLELARALMMKRKDGAASYNYQLAEQDDGLPPEILATIKAARTLLRDRRPWHLNFDVGLAPDTNINNATAAQTADLSFAGGESSFTLNQDSRAQSGTGVSGSISAGYRVRLNPHTALLADVDGQGVNYKSVRFDDYTVQGAFGPQLDLSDADQITVQATASSRWYGDSPPTKQFGARVQFEHLLKEGQRVGATIDARRSNSGFGPAYDGWSIGAYATYERVVMRRFIASASLFTRTDRLRSGSYSSTEAGINLGIGGELSHGINAGVSGGISRAGYDESDPYFQAQAPRKDTRYNARIYVGLRSVKLFGLSPSATYTIARDNCSLTLYDTKRQRFAFNLARYF